MDVCERTNHLKAIPIEEIGLQLALNVAIAIEHMVLRALDFGLSFCWVRLMDGNKVKEIFDWDENIYPVALLPIGYPAENPAPRKRRKIEEILILFYQLES